MPQAAIAVAAAFASAAAAVTAVTSTVVLGLTVGTWLTLGATALSVGMAMSAAAEAKKAAKGIDSGSQLQLKAAGDGAPVPFLFGRSATGGYLVYRGSWGEKNSELGMIAALSGGGPIGGIESYLAGDYGVGFNTNPNTSLATATGTQPDSELYAGKMRQRWLSGASTDGSPLDYAGYIGDAAITSAFKLSGIAHAWMQWSYDTKRIPSLPSKNLWVASGLKLYDPRKDSTYPGGSGAHRWGQPATYEFTENPGVVALNWCLGIFDNGKRVGGIGAAWDELDVGAFVAMANVCDSPDHNWKVGGVVTSDDNKFSVLNAILQAGGAVAANRGAQLSVIQNAPKASVYTLGTDDIVGAVEITNTAGFRDRKNTIIPRYRSESQNWEIIAGETVTGSTYVTEDAGETRSTELQYALVQQAAQAHQLAAYDMVNGREFLQATVVCKPRLLNVRVGEAITVNVPDLAITSKKMLVVGRSLDPSTLQVTLNLRSETDAKHAFALGQTQTAPPSPTFDPYDPSNPPAPGALAWSITATSIANSAVANGAAIPALVIEGQSDDPNAASVIFEARPFDIGHTYTDDENWISAVELPAATVLRATITGLYPETPYQAAVSYRTVRGVVSKRLILGPVTVGPSISGGVADGGIDWLGNAIINIPPALIVDGNGKLDPGAINWGPGVVIGDIANSLATLDLFEQQLSDASNAAIQAGTSVLTLRSYTDGLIYDANGLAVGTRITNEANARQTADTAIANSVTALQSVVSINNTTLTAGIATVSNTVATTNAALSTRIDTVQAGLTTNTATLAGQITNVSNALATANSIQTTNINTVSTRLNTNTATLSGQITTVSNSLTTANSALSTRIDGVQSNLTTANAALDARVTAVSTALTTANSALSSRIDGVSSALSVANAALDARILSEISTRTSQDGALSSRIDTTQAAIATNASVLQANINAANLAAVTNTNALAGSISSLDTRFTTANSTLTAAISSEVTARVNANTAISARVDTLKTTVDGHTSTITTYGTSIGGLQGKYGVRVAAGGFVSGFETNAGTGGSNFNILADNFGVYNTSGQGGNPLYISGGLIYLNGNVRLSGDLVITGTIRTATLEEYAVTRAISGSYQGAATLPNTSWTTLHSLVLPTVGAPVAIMGEFSFFAAGSAETSDQYTLTLVVKRNGTTIHTKVRSGYRGGDQVVIMTDDTPGAGNNTYTLEAIHDGVYLMSYSSSYLGLRETKR